MNGYEGVYRHLFILLLETHHIKYHFQSKKEKHSF
jgi:hypothetical protein